MKKLLLIFTLFFGSCLSIFAQNFREVVYLKNGSIIKGIIIEQIPNESLKIQTYDGSIFAYKMSEVVKITKEFKSRKNHLSRNRITFNDDKAITSGYKGLVDFGYTFGVGDFGMDRLELLTTHGLQFNPYIFAGIGTGINYYTDGDGIVVPVFADVRGTFIKGNITPFIDLKVGYSFIDLEGFYMSPSVGCRFGLGERLGLNVSFGYSMQKAEYYDYYDSYNVTVGGVNLKIGLDF